MAIRTMVRTPFPFIDTVELLRATVTHVKQKHIQAFYKTANGMFIIVLTSDDYKRIYPQELNFREQIQNEILNFQILPNPPSQKRPNRQGTKGSKYDPDTIFVTMFLPTTISNAAVKKAFMEFGEVHTVFAGQYKEEEFQGICNGKIHMCLKPLLNQSMTSPVKFNLSRTKGTSM